MGVTLSKCVLRQGSLQSNALLFWPESPTPPTSHCALISHGYTSHKDSLLNWASRLAEERIPTVLFDLPGHYLGSFNEVERFEDFAGGAHLLFERAFEQLSTQ